MIEETIKILAELHYKIEQEKFNEIYHEYVKLYPRLGKKPELRQLLTQMIKLYLHIEQLWDDVLSLYSDDIREYQRMMKLLLKIMQEWERVMSRMGLTYTSQQYIPAAEKKVFDPKAVLRLTEKIRQVTEEVKQKLKEEQKKEKAKVVIKK